MFVAGQREWRLFVKLSIFLSSSPVCSLLTLVPVVNCRSSSSGILFDVSDVVGFSLTAG